MNESENNSLSVNSTEECATQSVKTVTVNNRVYKLNTHGVVRMSQFHTKFASLAKLSCVLYFIVCVVVGLSSIGIFIYAGHSGEYLYTSSKRGELLISIINWCMEVASEGIFPNMIMPLAESFFSISVAIALYSGLKDLSSNWNKLLSANLAIMAISAFLSFFDIENFTFVKIESIIFGGSLLLVGFGMIGNFKGKDLEAIGVAMLAFGVINIAMAFLGCHFLAKIEGLMVTEGAKGYGLTLAIGSFLYAYISFKLCEHIRNEDYDGENDE